MADRDSILRLRDQRGSVGRKKWFCAYGGRAKRAVANYRANFKALSAGKNYGLVGKNGAGHFVKMVHNGIEYGMMEAIAERVMVF